MSGGRPSRAESGRAIALSAVGLFAAVTGAFAFAGLWVLASPTSPLTSLLPLSPSHEALANARLVPGAGPADLDVAERETRQELALSPALATAWLRLAYIDYWRHQRLTDAGLADLRRSYEIAPLGPDASIARLKLVFELWPTMPSDMRNQALKELAAIRERDRDATREFANKIINPEGRLAIGAGIAVLDSEDALRASD